VTSSALPAGFSDEAELEAFMTAPSAALRNDLAAVPGDIMVLGVGGKMGPTLARLAKRAAPTKRVIGVARFSEPGLRATLEGHGVECIAADLLDSGALDALPEVENVVFMAGFKFGAAGRPDLTWAMNGFVPALVAQRCRHARIVALSTICVYPFADVTTRGPAEDVAPTPPPGEYANSCVARERMFEYFSNLYGTAGRLIRLSYAIDTRYGVLHDVGCKVYSGEPIDLATGHVNVIWQGDANEQILRALRHVTTPATPLNVSGSSVTSIRAIAAAFGARFGRSPCFNGTELPTAWIADTRAAVALFGEPATALETMIDWVADWIARDGRSLNKATHFETRDGTF
jgi:nucleoside-diphosphate-sugar epimerase